MHHCIGRKVFRRINDRNGMEIETFEVCFDNVEGLSWFMTCASGDMSGL